MTISISLIMNIEFHELYGVGFHDAGKGLALVGCERNIGFYRYGGFFIV